MERTEQSAEFVIGSPLPSFSLPGTDGSQYDQEYFADATLSLVVFTCNHCPYVKGSDEMLLGLLREYAPRGLKAVLISANDAQKYPDDSFEMMQKKAKEWDIPCPYLYDESQDVARSFDAQCTPECFLFDASGALIFHGSVSDNPRDPSGVSKQYLRTALDQALGGASPDPAFVHSIGCSIKWRY